MRGVTCLAVKAQVSRVCSPELVI